MESRSGQTRGVAVVWVIVSAALAFVPEARATMRYGDIQLSGNLQSQILIRTPEPGEFHLIQERNTFRLQYEHQVVKSRKAFGSEFEIPLVKSADFFAYYRFVYDSAFDLEPGGILENQDGSRAGKFEDLRASSYAFENVLREVFLDLQLEDAPISFRIGRQQVVWGEALNFRALDSVNALDLTWHLFFEAGLFGKVGFDELRIPAWTIKMLWDVGSVGPFSNTFVEAWDIPADFQPAEVHFSESPWGLPFRNAIRPGLAINLGDSLGLPLDADIQPCYDLTGNPEANDDRTDFSEAAETGLCPTQGLRKTTLRAGNYDRRDPADVNQFGIRIGATGPLGVTFTLNYMYRRHLGTDIPGAGVAKFQSGAVLADTEGFVELEPHETTDPSTRETKDVVGYLRIPVEYFYPYVNVFGVSLNFFEENTQAVWNFEATYTKDLPIFNANSYGNGIKKKDVILAALGFDRPVRIAWLNKRSAFQTFTQLNVNYILGAEKIRYGPGTTPGAPEVPIAGDVGIPNSGLIPQAFIDSPDVDRLKPIEVLGLTGFVGFFRGGSVVPNFFYIFDPVNWPSMAVFAFVDFYPTNNIILTPRFNYFTTFGRHNVNDPWAIGRSGSQGNRSEIQLKFVYQF